MATDDEKVARLRDLLPATGAGIYLDTATAGPLPAETAAAMREAEDWELRVGRAWDGREQDVLQREEEARAVIAALLGADVGQVTLARGLDDAAELARCAGLPGSDRPIDLTLQAGVVPVHLDRLGADAAMLACDRWLLGPEGTAALWLRDRPPPAGPRLPRTALIGVARSVGWLEMYVGLEWAFERTAGLVHLLYDALAGQAGITVLTPGEALSGVVTFQLANWGARAAVDELARRVHALVRAVPEPDAISASVAWFNTQEELERFVAAVAELARHSPATLPRRPQIDML